MAKYLACGNIMSDYVINPGTNIRSERHMGGPAFYALSGIKLWEDDVKLVTRTGADWAEDYEKWMDLNRVSKESVKVDASNVSTYQLAYDDNGKYITEKSFSVYGDQAMGYLKTHPEDIDEAIGADTIGIYKAEGADRVVWSKLKSIKEKYGFQMMWELECFNSGRYLEKVMEVLPLVEAWSLNNTEAETLFGINKDDDISMIRKLMELPIPFTFYRTGKKGAYAITKKEAYFCESILPASYVDQTGCGNCSTGAAGYALFSGYTPEEVLVMANITAGFNCGQFGPIPHINKEIREKAKKLLHVYLPKVVQII